MTCSVCHTVGHTKRKCVPGNRSDSAIYAQAAKRSNKRKEQVTGNLEPTQQAKRSRSKASKQTGASSQPTPNASSEHANGSSQPTGSQPTPMYSQEAPRSLPAPRHSQQATRSQPSPIHSQQTPRSQPPGSAGGAERARQKQNRKKTKQTGAVSMSQPGSSSGQVPTDYRSQWLLFGDRF